MTELEKKRATALGTCSFAPASWEKRFARDMAATAEHRPETELTPRQRYYLDEICYRYRRQLPAALVPAQRPSEFKEPPAPKAKPQDTPPAPQATIYHRAARTNNRGDVAALCHPTPRAIKLTAGESWTLRDEAVTCPQCLACIDANRRNEPEAGQ